MALLDPFSAQIVKLVRTMPDEALLALVRQQLDAASASVPAVGPAVPAGGAVKRPWQRRAAKRGRGVVAAVRPVAKKSAAVNKAARAAKRTTAGRQELLEAVERAVKQAKGVSASEIARATRVAQTRVASALRELKSARRIFQGGDRRFARYAADAKTAQYASLTARKTASGPRIPVGRRGR
ncbi:MAG: hypothetical protein HY744_28560 [Deltaproteobacteria bacterium]|nr:hypothetical protein [Deltaproteobacteria bacterium]